MPQDLSEQLLQLPGSKKHETAPTAAKLKWTNNIPIPVPGWEGEEDEALMRGLAPDRVVPKDYPEEYEFHPLHVPKSQSPDEFTVLSLPSYGRGSIIFLNSPIIVDGVKFRTITPKGEGSSQQLIEEKGEVFGTPVNLPKENYTAGFTSETAFTGDREYTEIWKNAGMRVREPMRFFEYERIFMTTGSESIGDVAKKFHRAKESGIAIWATRNPFTFEDAIRTLRPESRPADLAKLKRNADMLLQIQSEFLKDDTDFDAAQIAEIIARGEGAGEDEWFSYLSRGYGQQCMRKTSNGLVHGEDHRQNRSLGIEYKDLDDVSGLSDDRKKLDKNFGSWENTRTQSHEMADQIIEENLFDLVSIIDLKIIYNIANGRFWDTNVKDIVSTFMAGMKAENEQIYPEIAYKMQKRIIRYNGAFQTTGNDNYLYGLSTLCFSDQWGNSEPYLPNTPIMADTLFHQIFEEVRSTVDPVKLSPNLRRRFDNEYYELRYDYFDGEELVKHLDLYNKLIQNADFLEKYIQLADKLSLNNFNGLSLIEQFQNSEYDLFSEFITNEIEFDDDKADFILLFNGLSGLQDFILNLVACPPEKRADFTRDKFPYRPPEFKDDEFVKRIQEMYV